MIFRFFTLISICISSLFLSCSNKKTIELPTTPKAGYGPFNAYFVPARIYKSDSIVYSKLSGIPENWTDVKVGSFETNGLQSVYQDYMQGNISKERYESLQKILKWKPDTSILSKEPIQCKIFFAFHKDSIGVLKIIIDANNNLNFKDDVAYSPQEINSMQVVNMDSLALVNSIDVTYERFRQNKIEKVHSPLLVGYKSQANRIYYSFPQYTVAKLHGEEIAICSDYFMNFTYKYPWFVLLNNSSKEGEKVNEEDIILKNGYIEIQNKYYRVIGNKLQQGLLTLERTKLNKDQITSNQIGFKSFPVQGADFKTNTQVSLENLKGKYVLLDFWSVYCGPCIYELPDLKAFYDKIDKSKFEMVGLVADSPVKELTDLMNQYSINWPLLRLDNNDLLSQFAVYKYPTNFLIDKEGIIIAKDLRGKKLEEKIVSLINE